MPSWQLLSPWLWAQAVPWAQKGWWPLLGSPATLHLFLTLELAWCLMVTSLCSDATKEFSFAPSWVTVFLHFSPGVNTLVSSSFFLTQLPYWCSWAAESGVLRSWNKKCMNGDWHAQKRKLLFNFLLKCAIHYGSVFFPPNLVYTLPCAHILMNGPQMAWFPALRKLNGAPWVLP